MFVLRIYAVIVATRQNMTTLKLTMIRNAIIQISYILFQIALVIFYFYLDYSASDHYIINFVLICSDNGV